MACRQVRRQPCYIGAVASVSGSSEKVERDFKRDTTGSGLGPWYLCTNQGLSVGLSDAYFGSERESDSAPILRGDAE
jgi:hypothetical protein